MKTILKIFAILAVMILVAAGIYLLVENTSIVSNISGSGEHSELAAGERSERPEGDKRGERGQGDHHNEASITGGLTEMAKVIAKIGLITTFVLGIQFLFNKFNLLKKAKTTV